ncbi:hypothetical protein D3C87_2011740 [compost metagenome]
MLVSATLALSPFRSAIRLLDCCTERWIVCIWFPTCCTLALPLSTSFSVSRAALTMDCEAEAILWIASDISSIVAATSADA